MYYLIKKLKYFQEFSSKIFRNFKSVFETEFELFNNNYCKFCRISDPFEYLTIFILQWCAKKMTPCAKKKSPVQKKKTPCAKKWLLCKKMSLDNLF